MKLGSRMLLIEIQNKLSILLLVEGQLDTDIKYNIQRLIEIQNKLSILLLVEGQNEIYP